MTVNPQTGHAAKEQYWDFDFSQESTASAEELQEELYRLIRPRPRSSQSSVPPSYRSMWNPETMLIDYDADEAAIISRTRALLPVPLFANPLDYDRLDTMKAENGLVVIEDAACALGAEYRGNKVGG